MVHLWELIFGIVLIIPKAAPGTLDREIILDQNMKKTLRNSHNNFRSQIAGGRYGQPKASNMKKLVWNEEIAKKSQEWANRCDWEHRSSDRNAISNLCGTAGFSHIGENLAAGTMFNRNWATSNREIYRVINQSVQGWFDEHKFFTFPSFCRSGEQCGHYTQLVWAESSHMGCGVASCKSISGLSYFGLSYYVVCNYGPGGNIIINGERSAPYETGAACTECPADRPTCSSNLCSGHGELPCVDADNYMVCKQFKLRGYCQMCSEYFWQMSRECNETCGFCKLQYQHGGDDLGDSGGSYGAGSGAYGLSPMSWISIGDPKLKPIVIPHLVLIAILVACITVQWGRF